ncbi:MAG TPA: GAF domain-containing sensor histidine kinase [Steroidobacteraceae bacterium]|nr:GAF domain-containing sensor histidine kinase [Steroidobacteraceae bacterium]
MSVSVADAALAHLESLTRKSTPCTEELSQINESLRRREALLVASAKASRMLLEAPDVRGAIPEVLRLMGDAAHVDRVNVMLARSGPQGEPLLVVVSEWTADGVPPHIDDPSVCTCDERQFSAVSAELRAGRSVCLNKCDTPVTYAGVAGFEGIGTKTKAIVPIFVAGEFIGVVGFDNTRQRRAIDSAELAALENAAGVIGAALHRQRLIDDMRRERERAAEERVAELAKANAVIRGNLERLASEPDLHSFLGHVLLEATRQFDAASGAVVVAKDSLQQWRIAAHVRDGQIEEPPYPISVPINGSSFGDRFTKPTEPMYLDVEQQSEEFWPGMLAFHRQEGYAGTVVYPLVFGSRNVGFLILRFRRIADDVQHSELLVALAQQATLAVQLTRLAYQAKEAAVLVERARIGQEIHDGLAQAFTGILMQLGAVEEFPSCKKKNSGLALTHTRIRDLAREGLAEARRSVMALRLDQTRRAGLEIALRQLAERSTVPGGVTCNFEGGGITTGLKPEHEHELLRIAQEAVSNAVRHARPNLVRITMTDEEAHWVLAVEDDGRGMEHRPELYAREGFGLTSMRQRASAIGGEWQIESQPGAGTRVSVRLPKRKAAA